MAAEHVPERASRARQRQRLIDACISALHMHGPSRTTVEKVVALADLSPGIVRFYFDSKDAMLVASLAYLAAEFEERVMQPVTALKADPEAALQKLVQLYVDPDIASPRKVSVWYSFWGEASSRDEYLQICGKKDDDFAALVHELIAAVIGRSGQTHLDADAIALGLIGVLEVLWQGFAFTEEANIDRAAAQRRSLAYLRSVFPGRFDAPAAVADSGAGDGDPLPDWVYADARLQALERERLFRPSWQLAGHEADVPQSGDYLTAELAGVRVLVVRAADGRIRAFRNQCRKRPHVLLPQARGHLDALIECAIHELHYDLEGHLQSGSVPGDLAELELTLPGRFMLVRAAATDTAEVPVLSNTTPLLELSGAPTGDWASLPGLQPAGVQDIAVAADWKLLVEQWLEALPRPNGVRRTLIEPNQLIEVSPSAAVVLQVIPESPGRCRIRRLDYLTGARSRAKPPTLAWLQQDIEVAESMQAGFVAGMVSPESQGPMSAELAAFRRRIAALSTTLRR